MITPATRAFFSRFATRILDPARAGQSCFGRRTLCTAPKALRTLPLLGPVCARNVLGNTRADLSPPSHDHFLCSPIGVIIRVPHSLTTTTHDYPPPPPHPPHHQAILEDSTAGKHGDVLPLTIPASNTERHRVSCHRCGNLRKRNVLCSRCPHTFCCRCSDKMREEHGVRCFVCLVCFCVRVTNPINTQPL